MYRKMNHISRRIWKEQNDEERIGWNILLERSVHNYEKRGKDIERTIWGVYQGKYRKNRGIIIRGH